VRIVAPAELKWTRARRRPVVDVVFREFTSQVRRRRRVWTKRVKYDVRKNFAETRLRVKGRFVKKEEEDLLKDLVGVV